MEALLEAPVVKKSNEDDEVLNLIQKYKDGDDEAGNLLYSKFKKLIFSYRTKLYPKVAKDFREPKDFDSILNIIFVEAIYSYNPLRAKFSTHLCNMLQFKFLGSYLKERLMPVSNNAGSEKIAEMVNKTTVYPVTSANLDYSDQEGMISFKFLKQKKNSMIDCIICGENFLIPSHVFISHIMEKIVEKNFGEKETKIFKSYLEKLYNNENITDLFEENQESSYFVRHTIKNCAAKIKELVTLNNIQYI